MNLIYTLTPLFFLMMLCNFYTHLILANLRTKEDPKARRIPKGFLFELVSCPNYTFEILEWLVYAVMSQSIASWVFLLVGGGQMTVWAIGKHNAYKKEFTGENGIEKYPRRNIVFPFLF